VRDVLFYYSDLYLNVMYPTWMLCLPAPPTEPDFPMGFLLPPIGSVTNDDDEPANGFNVCLHDNRREEGLRRGYSSA